jgi:hypothetical protein
MQLKLPILQELIGQFVRGNHFLIRYKEEENDPNKE